MRLTNLTSPRGGESEVSQTTAPHRRGAGRGESECQGNILPWSGTLPWKRHSGGRGGFSLWTLRPCRTLGTSRSFDSWCALRPHGALVTLGSAGTHRSGIAFGTSRTRVALGAGWSRLALRSRFTPRPRFACWPCRPFLQTQLCELLLQRSDAILQGLQWIDSCGQCLLGVRLGGLFLFRQGGSPLLIGCAESRDQ